ncbi:hypothetical protein RFI_14441 [Reticulomyxa filosa]|uniref:Protein kinase domain-containing protein n=1 Tax=Reticulomyxa filosa TaxID=46433 RepID=X6NBQ1_RETFI|nr:hypothetical protein RFI_14441 [Reticulomyxa filosa]|eukprot:ETO22752.1 hypothetical protein RFI_14441 [Reticulomyxa filosa]
MERLMAFEELKKTGCVDARFKSKYPAKLALLIEKMIHRDPHQRLLTDDILPGLNDLYSDLCSCVNHCSKFHNARPCSSHPFCSCQPVSDIDIHTDPNPNSNSFFTRKCCHVLSSQTQPVVKDEHQDQSSLPIEEEEKDHRFLAGSNKRLKTPPCLRTDQSVLKMKNLQIDLLKDRISKLEALLLSHGTTNMSPLHFDDNTMTSGLPSFKIENELFLSFLFFDLCLFYKFFFFACLLLLMDDSEYFYFLNGSNVKVMRYLAELQND